MGTDPGKPVEALPASPRVRVPPDTSPWKWTPPQWQWVGPRMTRPRSPVTRGRSRGRSPRPTRLACGSAPCHGARGARGPRRQDGAVCSPWSHTSARSTCPRAPPARRLAADHNLRVCLACQEPSAVGSRCPGPRCSSAVLAALAAGNSAPPGANTFPAGWGAPPGPGNPQSAGHAGSHAAQGTHRGLIQLRPGPDVPAASPGARADVGGPGPSPSLPPHRAGRPAPRREGYTILLNVAMSPQLPVVGPRPPGGAGRPRETGFTSRWPRTRAR